MKIWLQRAGQDTAYERITSRATIFQFIKPHLVWFIIAFGILIRLPLVFTPLTYSVTDTWRQADTASIAHNFTDLNASIFYPQIHWGGRGPGYVETEFQLYPFIVSLLYRVFGEQVWLGRFVSLIFTFATFIVFHKLARYLLSHQAALWSLFFFAIAPLSIRYSVAFMPEATVLFFYVTSLYLFQKWLDEQNLLVLLFAAVSTALAILVKPTSIHIGLVFLLLLIARYRFKLLQQWQLWLLAIVSLLPGALWYLHARNLFLTYGNTFGVISGGDSKFGNLGYWLSSHFYASLAKLELNWVFAGGGVLLFAIGIVLAFRKRQPLILLFGVLIIPLYYMIVARYAEEEWGIQYHIYAIPFAALGVGIGIAWLFKSAKGKLHIQNLMRSLCFWAGATSILWITGWSMNIYRSQLLVPTAQSLWDCAFDVTKTVPEGMRIIVSTTSVAIDNGIPNNFEEPNIFFYSHRYGWSLPADWHTPQKVDEYRRDGAQYFVIYSSELYGANPPLAEYLAANAQQIGPGLENGCGIFRFNELE